MTPVLTRSWHHPSPAPSTAAAPAEVAGEDDPPPLRNPRGIGENRVPEQAGTFLTIAMVALGHPGSIPEDSTATAELVPPAESVSYDNNSKM